MSDDYPAPPANRPLTVIEGWVTEEDIERWITEYDPVKAGFLILVTFDPFAGDH